MTKTLTVREAAQKIGCTTKYIFDLLYSNRLRGAQKVGRQWTIPAAAIGQRLREREARNG